MNRLFSVIVPIFNKEKYLKECINSILSQSFTNYELILVDDGSNDDCPKIIDEYAKNDSRIAVIHKDNGGLVSARKAGAKKASGEYIVCVDADDYIEKDHLLNISKEIEKHQPDIVCAGYTKLKNNQPKKIILDYRKGIYLKKDIEKEIFPSLIQAKDLKHFPVNIWSKAYKRQMYIDIQLNVGEKVKIGEDGAVSIPYIYKANTMSIIDDCSYVYRLNTDSMTSNVVALQEDYPKIITNEYIKYIDIDKHDFKDQINRFVIHQLFIVCLSQFNNGEPYKKTKERITKIINDEYYREAIEKTKSNSFKLNTAKFILKTRAISLMHLLRKI